MRKGQFMLISSIIVGIIIISVANMVSKANTRQIENSDTAYILQNIREEAREMNVSKQKDRENFRKLVGSIERYSTKVSYWRSHNPECMNVTLTGYRERYRLNCIR